MKKKLLLLTLCLCATLISTAQTQHGIVKTPGRLASNGKVIAGKRIAGATVQVKGRTAVKTAADGTFSFPVPGNKFFIQSVKKQGYILVDPEAITRQYTYSSNPITLALVLPTEQADDKLAKERQIRNTLEKKLHAREDEIEGLKAQNKISQEDYRKAMQQLYAEQESNEKLIKDMAERYTRIDFDELDEFNLRISDCILNGRLTEADSLLRTKGDINARINRLNKQHEANVEVRDNLEKSEALEQKDRDEIAQDCYHRYELFAMDHQNDSAAHYLELRAALDTTNVVWQGESGIFIRDYQANDILALHYFHRGLQQAQIQYGKVNMLIPIFYNYIGEIYTNNGEFDKAHKYLSEALTLWQQLDTNNIFCANTYNDIGLFYDKKGEFDNALAYYEKALDIRNHILGVNNPHSAQSYNNLGLTYIEKGDYDKGIEYLLKALEIRKNTYTTENISIANSYSNLGAVYSRLDRYEQALDYLFKARDINKKLFNNEIHPSLSTIYQNIGNVYSNKGDYLNALDYDLKALNIISNIYGTNHISIADKYNNIGYDYNKLGQFNIALDYYFKALAIEDSILGKDHPNVASTNTNIGEIYCKQGEYDKAIEYHLKAIKSFESSLGIEHPSTAIAYNNLGKVYDGLGDFDHALEYFFKALSINEKSYGIHSSTATVYLNIGIAYNNKREFNNAIEYFTKALSIFENVLGTEHPTTTLCYYHIGSVYRLKGDFKKALDYFVKVLNNREKEYGSEHSYTGWALHDVGTVYCYLGEEDKGLDYLLKALEIEEKTLGINDPSTVAAYHSIGTCYVNKGDFANALTYQLKALSIREKLYGPNHPNVLLSYNNLWKTYYQMKDHAKALEYLQKGLEIKKTLYGDSNTEVISDEKFILLLEYDSALYQGKGEQFLHNHCLTATVGDGGPAQQQGMSGEYVLLEFGDWTEDSYVSLFDKSEEMKGKPKDIVVLKDGVISKHHFEDVMGVQLGVKEITKEERERINQLYKTWKRDQALLDVWNSRKKDNSINKQSD